MLKLGFNVDHVATVRQARLALKPDPVEAALEAIAAGAHGITAHLREDRRHIQDKDMERLAASVPRLNMEMAVTDEMVSIASSLRPACCCLVPEKRRELTTEGGLDVLGNLPAVKNAVERLADAGIVVSLFIDPDPAQVDAASKSGAPYVELHTGVFAEVFHSSLRQAETARLAAAAAQAVTLGLKVNAGHGIDYENISGILGIAYLEELNIGHSIVARAVFVGVRQAVREMLDSMKSIGNQIQI